MSPSIRRLVITGIVLGLAAGIVLISVIGRRQPASPAPGALPETQAPVGPAAEAPAESAQPPGQPGAPEGDAALQSATEDLGPLHAVWVPADVTPQAVGSLDPRQAKVYMEFSTAGAGIQRITLSEFWQTAAESRQAKRHYEAMNRGAASPPPLPAGSERYVLQSAQPRPGPDGSEVLVPALAADTIVINGQSVRLSNQAVNEAGVLWTFWSETAPGRFEASVVDADDRPIARITREFTLGDGYDIACRQRVDNLTDKTLAVGWKQYGPGDLTEDRSRYMDRRRLRFGYLPDPAAFPDLISSNDNDVLFERAKALKLGKKARGADPAKRAEILTLWPNETSRDNGYELAWFATTNRYFALAVHPELAAPYTGSKSLEPVVESVRVEVLGADRASQVIFTGLYSPVATIAPGGSASFDMGVYAGPLDPEILGKDEPMASLKMQGLILYQMSSLCALCTFQWLAHILLAFLSIVHAVVFDWGLAIIILVLVVRALLHPLTKRAQINMQRFGKVMSELKPEIDKLQKKYKDDPRKLQQEQMRMMRERGVNPFQMLGCLPMFLQMPIWVALYASLYFAFELRHQPAFWGIFQHLWNWPFLGDLSAADHCFWEFSQPFHFFIWNVTGINLLPILMGLVFFFQQKYMSPPPSPTMGKEQLQQQKIMKIMMVVMFPVMLYSAPSGLTLYIFTSSSIGIIESRYIRRHINEMDLNPPKAKPKKKKPRNPQARAFADAMDRARSKKKPPPKKYKKRR